MAEFVITYKRRSGESFIKRFSVSTQALKERLHREAGIHDPDVEIAHISAPLPRVLEKVAFTVFHGQR